jgi:hypothetical protein
MDGERAVVVDVSNALYAAAERLPSGSPWIDAFCGIAQLIEGEAGPGALTASERLRRRGIQARARTSAVEPRCAEHRGAQLRAVPFH